MFRKQNGISEKLYKTKRFLYLKTDRDNFNLNTAKDYQNSILRNVEDSKPIKVILDMKNISRIDSAGVGVLIHVRAECEKNKCEVVLLNVNDTVLKVFQLLNMLTFFTILKSLDEL